jgi:4-hydroxy-tetrahydrodipicolinate reductase
VGKACIREILKRPEFDLVGVMGFSKEKVGRDVGELLGGEPIGLTVSGDRAAMIGLEADVVVWTGNPFADMGAMEAEIVELLESGKNVVNAAGQHFPPRHGQAYVDRLEAACRAGNTSVFGSGENPGFWLERIATTLTGLCSRVELIFLDEYVDVAVGGTNAETLRGVGFGLTVAEVAHSSERMQAMWRQYFYVESMEMIAQSIYGRGVDGFEVEPTFHTAERPIVLDQSTGDPISITIEAGQICAMSYTFTGRVEGTPRIRIRVNWFLGSGNSPFEYKTDDIWKIEIEAQPVSLRCQFEAFASLRGNLKFRPGDDASPFMYITGMPLVQAIPIVVEHEAGFVVPSVFTNCVPDFRTLATRRALVDTPGPER